MRRKLMAIIIWIEGRTYDNLKLGNGKTAV